mgnify:CR=1 FL=1
MSRRQIGQESFGFRECNRRHSSLDSLAKLVDWAAVDQRLADISNAAKGEPACPPLSLFKALMLAVWYDLSDVKLAGDLQQVPESDLQNFKTNFGVHRSDFSAIFIDKNAPSSHSSTGEQKSIMLGITMARAKISTTYKNQPTILIFDEVMSHLDEKKKSNLLEEILQSNLQCFVSATSQNLLPEGFRTNNSLQIINLA